MTQNFNEFKILTTSLAVSLALNGATLLSLDRVFQQYQQVLLKTVKQEKLLKSKKDTLEFQFVEAPVKTHPAKPSAETKNIAARDALNQQQTALPAAAPEVSPKTGTLGPSDQLAQQRSMSGQQAMPEVKPQPAPKPFKEASIAELPSPDMVSPAPKEEARPPQKAQEPLPGLTGRDKITTQEMSKKKSTPAKLEGVTSFEATGSGMGEYMKNLKEKVWLAWFPYLAFQYPVDFKMADAVISFTLDKDGEVKIVKVLDSEGSPVFASYCVESIQRASPFGPLPLEILAILNKDELEIRFAFHYR